MGAFPADPVVTRCIELQRWLEEVCARRRVREAWVGFVDSGGSRRAVVSPQGSPGTPFDVEVGCLAKVLTAMLVSKLVEARKLGFNDPVTEHLEAQNGAARRALARTSIVHLLNHTHGLDGSGIGNAPLSPDGYLDTHVLCNELCGAGCVAEPGDLYNYGSAGVYVAAALLEKVHGRRFTEILIDEVLNPLGITLRRRNGFGGGERASAVICPAWGNRMLLSFDELMALLRHYLALDPRPASRTVGPEVPCAAMFQCVASLPGWSPIEKGAAIGWKYYGVGWFGHNANFPGGTVLIRLHSGQRRAIVVAVKATNVDAAFPILDGVFGDVLPSLVTLNLPTLLTTEQWQSVDSSRFTGIYANRSQTVSIESRQGMLHVILQQAPRGASDAAPCISKRLRPAAESIFFPEPGQLETLPFIQFVRPEGAGQFQYIWNGRHVWRRRPG